MLKKLIKNKSGFSLTEVMIGIMILTVAIVSASNLLIHLMRSNQINLSTLQAYYLAQEGLEAVRNIRDTNWLHNQHWLGEDSGVLWDAAFEVPEADEEENLYSVDLAFDAFGQGPEKRDSFPSGGIGSLNSVRTWTISPGEGIADENGFKRTVSIKNYPDGEDFVLVEVTVKWDVGLKERELKMSEVLSDWKGGAL